MPITMPMTIPKFGPMNVVTMMLPGVGGIMNQPSFNQIIRVQQGKLEYYFNYLIFELKAPSNIRMVKKQAVPVAKPKIEVKKEVKKPATPTPTPPPATPTTTATTPKKAPVKVSSPKAPPPPDKNVAKIELKIGNWGEKAKSPRVNSDDRLISIKPKEPIVERDEKEPEAKKRKVEKVKFDVKKEKTESPATTPRQVEETVEETKPEVKKEEKKQEQVMIVQQGEIRNRSGSKTRILLLSPVNQGVRKRYY